MNYETLLKTLVQKDDRLVVMTAENRAVIRSLPSLMGDRFIDTGITEQTMIGAAAGLALRGRIPVVHALATFLTLRPFEFIRTDVGIPGLPVKLVAAVPGFYSEANGPTHQAIEDVSLMRGIPGMQVFCPGSQEDLVLGLEAILMSPHPSYIRFNPRSIQQEGFQHQKEFKIGKAEVISRGKDVALLTYGALLNEALDARRLLEAQGLSVHLVNMRTLKPIDEEAVLEATRSTKLVVTLEDHFQTGGLYSIVAELYLKNRVTADVLSLSLGERWFKPALLKDVLDFEGFSGPQIAEKIMARVREL